jgi:CRP-like cAMP-binding protein
MSEIPLFDSLNVGEMQETVKWLAFKRLEKGTVVYRQGTAGRSICFVVEGELAVVMHDEGGDARIGTVGKGQSVGEMSVIDGMTRSADVIAATDTSVLILKQDSFEKLCSEHPAIGMKILKSLARGMSMTLRERSESLARLMHA